MSYISQPYGRVGRRWSFQVFSDAESSTELPRNSRIQKVFWIFFGFFGSFGYFYDLGLVRTVDHGLRGPDLSRVHANTQGPLGGI